MTLDWNNIRPLNGGRDKGFEELCAQLADAEKPAGSRFERKGTPDAGVECYAVLNAGSEWGWQAKYIDVLGDSQWSQIDRSVETAIEKHPRLVRYFVCVPLDRPDARIEGQRSARDKWDERVAKWTKQAAGRRMAVEFVYWGSYELLERLARPEHVGRVRFWFDVRGFDAVWFNSRLDEALRTAGPRYTPEVHVDLPVALEFEAFGRTKRFFDRIKTNARNIRKQLRTVEDSEAPRDAVIDAAVATVSAKVQAVLNSLGAINPQATGPLPFKAISEQARAAERETGEFLRLLEEREQDFDAKPEPIAEKASQRSYRGNPFRNRRIRIYPLTSELRSLDKALGHADAVAGSALMLLRGAAGTGKTHLLCDVTRQRVAAARPTVLLMGQRFVSSDAPWTQALQQLDLPGMSAEEFVGALEAAAQAAGARALLVIDAMNEGAGRSIWPSHLEAFLAYAERSSWIGVVLAVRSSYEEIVIPEGVRRRVPIVTHQGFAEHEYDATKTFFFHYGLELPSTPMLAPEFRNPLFLKTLCLGLHAKGERRLPRGFHGITAVFDLYLMSINQRLASGLGFDGRIPLVRQALEAVAKATLDSGETWLTHVMAAEVVNSFLPGREFERSLYRGLVAEGVLVEEAALRQDATEEVVFVAYERFADHLAAKALLDRHLDPGNPALAFAQGGALAHICDEKTYVSPGLLEALCIQIPERTGQELIHIAPNCVNRWGLGAAFRQSLIWRTHTAFSDSTREATNKLCQSEQDFRDTLEVLLTVATLPGHPLNARFLDWRLQKDAMADRDAWWSTYLHQAWGTEGAVRRLIDWASSITPGTSVDDETVELCAVALSWMLTTSNRFLRDRATKALVSLLTGRLSAAIRLVEQFADVDDPYVTERVYAVAYGIATRSHDPVAVGSLAAVVYDRIFAAGSPPRHILLRDYARGVVERALYLRSTIEVMPDRIRPPYKSAWPTIPTEEEIKPLMPDWSKGSHDSGEAEWGRNRIGSSVMDDDFARYVIGTNSSFTSWLSLRLDEPPWKPPPRLEDRLHSLVGDFSDDERSAWKAFEIADSANAAGSRSFVSDWLRERDGKETSRTLDDTELEDLAQELEKARPPEIAQLEEKRRQAVVALEGVLTVEHARRLTEIWAAKENDYEARQPPRFDLRQIQRYILWRVFDLGYTTERFGHFDRFSIGHDGREATKAERIGKKYQWIAYHEIMAFLSDHFQYREQFREEEGDQVYEGPWQENLRDIDPSCTMRSLRGGTSWGGHAVAWWGPARYDAWGDPNRPRDWVLSSEDMPRVVDLLIATNPVDKARWLNGQGFFMWKQPPPADRESTDVEHREIWYSCTGYLLRADDAPAFLQWAEGVDFWGRWMPDAAEVYQIFLGEHTWAPASRYFQKQYFGDDGWMQPNHGCPVKLRTVAFEYLRETSGFDCSVDDSYKLRLPVSELITGLRIRWSGRDAGFVDAVDQVAVQDPAAHAEGPTALLIRENPLREFLAGENLTICWAVLGEKRVISPGFGAGPYHPSLRMSGAYVLSGERATGFIKHMLDDPEERSAGSKVISIVRSAV